MIAMMQVAVGVKITSFRFLAITRRISLGRWCPRRRYSEGERGQKAGLVIGLGWRFFRLSSVISYEIHGTGNSVFDSGSY